MHTFCKYLSFHLNEGSVCVRCSVMSQSLVIPWTHQAPLSMEFSRQEYWSGCHFLLQGIFWTQGSNSHLRHWQVDSLPLRHQGSQFSLTELDSTPVITRENPPGILSLHYLGHCWWTRQSQEISRGMWSPRCLISDDRGVLYLCSLM